MTSPTGPSLSSITAGAQPPAPETVARIRELIAAGKCKQAVELAKEYHKKHHNAASEELIVEAYYARVEQFLARGASEDAQTLLKLVAERFPAQRARFDQLQVHSQAAQGNLAALIAPLTRPELTPELRGAIESALRREWTDLPALAACPALPADHPLRVAAAAIWKAFAAVTSGPVSDEAIALPEVSRRSPLADWKLLVRGLAAFYRNEDEACRRAIEAIAPDAAPHRLAGAVLAMIERKPAPAGAAAALAARVDAQDKPLRDAMAAFDRALLGFDLVPVIRSMRATLAACQASHPELYERLRQHVSITCYLADVPYGSVRTAIGTPLRNAYFWRLSAMADETLRDPMTAAGGWNRFVHHAIHEKLFAAGGLEEAAVWLHCAMMLGAIPLANLQRRRFGANDSSVFASLYADQPPEIAALKPKQDSDICDMALNPAWLFRRSAELDPDPDTFKAWLSWARSEGLPERSAQEIAETWQRKLPADPRAPLLLSSLAEGRKALKLSLNYLAQAEAIDAMNPEVRTARLRLTVATAWRHFNDRKPHLVAKDLAELEAMPAMRDGDRPAFLGVLRAAWFSLTHNPAGAQQAFDAVVDRVGPVLADVLMQSIARQTNLDRTAGWPRLPEVQNPDPQAVAEAKARMILLAVDLRFMMVMPQPWHGIVDAALVHRPTRLSPAHLMALGRCALDSDDPRQSYLASAAGLETATGRSAAAFLLMRARSLPEWAEQRRQQCLRAATQLARQANDPDLIEQISREIDRDPWMRRQLAGSEPLDDALMAEVIRKERQASAYPEHESEASRYVVAIESERDEEPRKGRRKSSAGEAVPFDFFEDEEDEDAYPEEEDDDEERPPGAPVVSPRLLAVLQQVVTKYGRMPPLSELVYIDPNLAVELKAAALVSGIEPALLEDMLNRFSRIGSNTPSKKRRKRRR